jgi:[acyl-carrier-protein] S-malonyltransferase
MAVALVFPGQGSQAVGMGAELAKAFPAARSVFDEVDAALGQKLSQVMFEGPIDTLTLTENAQPALLAVSMAAMRVLEERGFRLGQGAEGEVCQLANDNEPTQAVISGTKTAIDRAAKLAKEHGVRRFVPLNVSAPFHCALMQPAADAMADALATTTVNRPAVPLIANVTAGPISDPAEIKRRLVEQVTGTVRWREGVAAMAAAGVTDIVEVGAGKVLAGLAKRIVPSLNAISVGTPQEIEAALALLTAKGTA